MVDYDKSLDGVRPKTPASVGSQNAVPGRRTNVDNAYAGTTTLSGNARVPGAQTEVFPWDDAVRALDLVGQVIEADGQPLVVIDKGVVFRVPLPPGTHALPPRWRALVELWAKTVRATHEGGGDADPIAEIDHAMHVTEPVVEGVRTRGDREIVPWLAQVYIAPVWLFRQRVANRKVDRVVDQVANDPRGEARPELAPHEQLEHLRIVSTPLLKTLRAAATVSTRLASADAAQVDELFRIAMMQAKVVGGSPPVLDSSARNLSTALTLAQGLVYAVQTIVTVSDPHKRLEDYRKQARLHEAVSEAEMLKDLGVMLNGGIAVVTAATFAFAKLSGRDALAQQSLSWVSGASAFGKINVALNVLGIAHGVLQATAKHATTAERVEGGVEATSGALGVTARLLPVIAPVTASLSASLTINFVAFKTMIETEAEGVASLIATGLQLCYGNMRTTGEQIAWALRRFLVAIDLQHLPTDPQEAAAAAQEVKLTRAALVEVLRDFISRATTPQKAHNEDPGAYEVLRRRFASLSTLPLEPDEQLATTTLTTLEAIARCGVDAQQIFEAQVRVSISHDPVGTRP